METNIFTLKETSTVRDAIEYFLDKNISGVPIVSKDEACVGFISDGNIMRYLKGDENPPAAIDSSFSFINYLWNPDTEFEEKLNSIMDMNVLEIGNNKPITIQESASLEDACRLLSESGIKKVPVVNNGKVVGIISRSAITHYITKRYLENEKKA